MIRDFHKRRRAVLATAEPLKRYTQGFCGEYAVAIHLMTGLPIYLLHADNDPCGIHALVRIHQVHLYYYDVRGWQTYRELKQYWGSWGKLTLRPVTMGAICRDPRWDISAPEVIRAQRYIRRYRLTRELPHG